MREMGGSLLLVRRWKRWKPALAPEALAQIVIHPPPLTRCLFSSMACACACDRFSRSPKPFACTGHSPSALPSPPASFIACFQLSSSTPGGRTRCSGRATLRKRWLNL